LLGVRFEQSECGVMLRTIKNLGKYRDWQMVILAGVLGFVITLAVMEMINAYALSLTSLSIALAAVTGSLSSICLAGSFSAWRVRQKLSEQNMRLDGALNNMVQGLCMFDAQNRLVVWNERYRTMYKIDPRAIWRGCTIRDLLDARIAAGTFPLDPAGYDSELRAALKQGNTFRLNVELKDGRIIDVVNQPIKGGGWVATHEDITERKQAQARLTQETNENRRLFETSLDLILVTDRYGNLERVSPISSTILGYAPEEMVGHNAVDFVYPGDLESTRREIRLARSGHEMRNFETRYAHKDGRIVTLAWSGVWSEPEKKHFFTGRDVTESKIVEEKLKHLAHYDQLTGLANRTSLQNDLNEAIRSSDGLPGSATSIAIFDLDGFKDINDTLGHSIGDWLLQEVAQRMTELATSNGRFYRLGGDEFVIVQPDFALRSNFRRVVLRSRRRRSIPHRHRTCHHVPVDQRDQVRP
jgi:diguanylate cyclase (GGDEF)-like protein/PAS domain S-box-containing protein